MAEKRNKRTIPGTAGTVTVALVGKNETPVVMVEMETNEGPKVAELYLSQGALPYTVEKLAAAGLPAGRSITYLEENPNALQGNPINVFLYEELNEETGKWREKADISTFKREVKKMSPQQLAAFDNLFLNAAKAADLGF